jgi:hypothetical protein
MKRDECSPQEQWVLERLEQGEIADLKKQFGEAEENRRLSARFLEDLLTGIYKVHRKGITVKNAVSSDLIDLENAEISPTVGFMDCIFKGPVTLRDAYFKKHLNLSRTHFESSLDCQRTKVEGSLFIPTTTYIS